MILEVPIVYAFTDGQLGGNPAGIVLEAERFTNREKQRIAATVGLSETAFVSRSNTADIKLEFFTPSQQIAHCGHATIATFSYLQQTGQLHKARTSKETIDGRREIFMEGDMAYMEQKGPRYGSLESETLADVLRALNIQKSDLIESIQPCVVNTGNSFLVVGLKDGDLVKKLSVDQKQIAQISEALDLIGFYVFAQLSALKGRDAGARMFAPRYGIEEEAATGMAAGPLACYLHDKMSVSGRELYIEQGHWMPTPSPSLIKVQLNVGEDGNIKGLFAGGRAELREAKRIELGSS
ncbi:PhzF family phenazine biosynthesis protein [Marinobacter nauticus]|uniref:PhzF family phenazine biosynthesis protein n=1 Tax=Marinobacter nauticus TaxID=2743 RepID=UPI001C996050|nr:PhzF family phenazine biosynthesis protein [Marinobacter nauticus]MBY5938114.1 PhzF family phenazine biosynthesis protein [Marinobacter nauticus]MBY5955343.1 PhzF family phenazine biosynthesis protein [Marinobacter nauticus]MBY6009134.1 PhzF family phenazine biosynthesis protein [Marinobacter nauticus]